MGLGCIPFVLGSAQASEAPAAPGLSQDVDRAINIVSSGENLFEAYRILHAIAPRRLQESKPWLLERYWWALGRSCYELGRYQELEVVADHLLELGKATDGSFASLHGFYYRAAAALADEQRFDPKPVAIASMREVVQRAASPSEQPIKLLALLALAKLEEGETAWTCLEQARRIARSEHRPDYLFHVEVEAARRIARRNPAAGHALLQEAIQSWPNAEDPWSIYGWEARLEVTWAARPRKEAISFSLGLLDRIEAGRRRQEDQGEGTIGYFSVWARAYRRVAGLLLRDGPPSRDELELVFSLSERTRARVLLDELHGMGAKPPECADEAIARRLEDVRADISALQRTFPSDTLGRAEGRRRLENLMLDEQAIYRERPCRTSASDFVQLAAVEKSLDPREALLMFQTGSSKDIYGAYDGGSWVLLITSAGSRAFAIPDDRAIRLKRDALVGAIRRRDGSEVSLAAALYIDLMGGLERALPTGVEHLIIVPDGAIHGLPMAALRVGGVPLIEHYRLSYVPSATLWWRWRHLSDTGVKDKVVALCDPVLDAGHLGLWRSAADTRFDSLPASREEGRRAVRYYGRSVVLMEGRRASETALKQTSMSGVGLLLLATHAVVDQQSPRLSSILLAAGDGNDDGLLQPPEISQLRMDGAIVSLSGCQSAGGATIEGEGLLSLARSFFQAGSRAVIGNMWPVRDDEAMKLFDGTYRRLARGRSVAASVRGSQRERWRAGVPAEAWAGVVVLGDGSATYPAIDAQQDVASSTLAVVCLATLALALLLRLWTQSRA